MIASENAGSQAIWHAAISVGSAYGDGGTAARPDYFSEVRDWKMLDLTVAQPFAHAAIAIMSEASQGLIRGITIADSAAALIGIGLDWGTVGDLTSADATLVEMRRKFLAGEVYGTHPHDIQIQDIKIGRLTNVRDSDSAGIRTAGCYNISIRNVEIAEAGVGINIGPGDLGFELARDRDRAFAHRGYSVDGLKIERAHLMGLFINGLADNVYRAIRNNGYDALLSPTQPGIDAPDLQNIYARGTLRAGSAGVQVSAATRVSIRNLDVGLFDIGLLSPAWLNELKIVRSSLSNNAAFGVTIRSTDYASKGVEIGNSFLLRNGPGRADNAQIYLSGIVGAYVHDNRIGEDSSVDARYGVWTSSSSQVQIENNVFGLFDSSGATVRTDP